MFLCPVFICRAEMRIQLGNAGCEEYDIHTYRGRLSRSLGITVSKMVLLRVTILVFITTGKDIIVGKGSLSQSPQYISHHRTESGILRSVKTRHFVGSLQVKSIKWDISSL
jgi:hypothetical protein